MTDTLWDRLGACAHKQLKKQLVGEQVWYACECGQKFHAAPWDGRVSVLAAQPAPAVMGEGAARKRLLYEPLGDFSFSQHVAAKLSTLLTAKYTNSQKIVAGIIKQEIEAVFREVDAEGRTAAAESREESL